MNQVNDQPDDWSALMQAWQTQATPSQDLKALQREVARRSRRLRCLRWAELSMAAIALGNCLRALLMKSGNPIPAAVLLALMGVVIGYTCWVQWQRRRQWHARTLDPRALIAFESDRTRTSIRIWRVSTWISMALWVALTLWGIMTLYAGPGPGALPAQVWALNIGANAMVVLVSAGLGYWMGQRRRNRLARLRALQDALDAD